MNTVKESEKETGDKKQVDQQVNKAAKVCPVPVL